MNSASRKLGELLVDRHLLSKDVLETVLAKEQTTGTPMAKILTDDGLVREEDLLRTVAARVGMEYVELDDQLFDPEAIAALSGDVRVRNEPGCAALLRFEIDLARFSKRQIPRRPTSRTLHAA